MSASSSSSSAELIHSVRSSRVICSWSFCTSKGKVRTSRGLRRKEIKSLIPKRRQPHAEFSRNRNDAQGRQSRCLQDHSLPTRPPWSANRTKAVEKGFKQTLSSQNCFESVRQSLSVHPRPTQNSVTAGKKMSKGKQDGLSLGIWSLSYLFLWLPCVKMDVVTSV